MNANSRFAVAIHILTVLAYSRKERVTSECIAMSVSTNPVVIRRTLGDLRRAGLVDSLSGSCGGWKLIKPADTISLHEAYCAVRDGLPFGLPAKEPNPRCIIGAQISEQMIEIFNETEKHMGEYLHSVSIDDILNRMKLLTCGKEKLNGETIE